MPRKYVFADESGNFDFSLKTGASRFFVLTTISCDSFAVGDALLVLRREIAWKGMGLNSEFHATTDRQAVRDLVFGVLRAHDFRIDATILEKLKAPPGVRESDEGFYRHAWHHHFRRVALRIAGETDELMVVGASLGTKRKRAAMHEAVSDVVTGAAPAATRCVAAWEAHSDPCLQVADYCCWAIARKWERGDARAYDLISGKIGSEVDLYAAGATEP